MAWKIGVLGLIHDHVWQHIAEMATRDDITISVADPNAPLREKARDEFGVTRLYDDYASLLGKERPDAELIFVDNAGKADLVELAASFGRPIMIEKPMADSLVNAERMRVAAVNAGVPLMVNWPTAWLPAIRHALQLAQDDAVGEIYRFSFRGGHRGPKEYGCSPYFYNWLYDRTRNGAGAYIDYCGYGASMARLLCGMPSRVNATIGRLVKPDIDVDDNAVLTLRYQHALAVIEGTWSASGPVPDGGPAIWGRGGTLVVRSEVGRREGDVRPNGVVQLTSDADPDGRFVEPPNMPEGERSAIQYLLTCLKEDRPIDGLVSMEIGRDTQEILEAGLRAAREDRGVSLPL
ncbi:MAG TPA: Gfo/Idh/MocA family oxidoreductase [Nitrolancea sp.]|jgi:predicted dehydrogenase|nr:Gfo/Idh/MocA family oxidoreductase [Nitrolancea sp.]